MRKRRRGGACAVPTGRRSTRSLASKWESEGFGRGRHLVDLTENEVSATTRSRLHPALSPNASALAHARATLCISFASPENFFLVDYDKNDNALVTSVL